MEERTRKAIIDAYSEKHKIDKYTYSISDSAVDSMVLDLIKESSPKKSESKVLDLSVEISADSMISSALENLENVDIAKVDGDGLMLTEESEDLVYKILLTEKLVKEMKSKVSDKITDLSKEHPNMSGYSGKLVKIGKPLSKKTKKISNEKLLSPKFYEVQKKLNTKAVNAYFDAVGKLPPGIELSESKPSVSMTMIK